VLAAAAVDEFGRESGFRGVRVAAAWLSLALCARRGSARARRPGL